jgi:hypothetical protein
VTVYDRPFGRHYEDFEIDDVYRHWPGKTITEADDHLFCMITMNHHPTHINDWFAENESPMGRALVVGNLVYSLVLGMSVPDVSGAAIANLEVTPSTQSRRSSRRRRPPTEGAASSPSSPRASTSAPRRCASSAGGSWSGSASSHPSVVFRTAMTSSPKTDTCPVRRRPAP